MKVVYQAAALLLLAGCASVRNAEDVIEQMRVEEYPARGQTDRIAPPLEVKVDAPEMMLGFRPVTVQLKLSSWPTGDFWILGVGVPGSSWLFLDRIETPEGLILPTRVVDRRVGYGGSTFEFLVVTLDRERLRAARLNGLSLRAYGRRGRVNVEVPPWYVDGFLSATASSGGDVASNF